MPMATSTEWQRARNNISARKAVVLKLVAGGTTWLLSDKELILTDGTVHQVILNHGAFMSGFDIFSSRTKIVDVTFTLSNFRYRRDATANGWITLSDELTALRGTTAEVYFLLGDRMASLSDGLKRFSGTIVQQPEYNADTIQIRIVNKGAMINYRLPQNTVNSAFSAAPEAKKDHRMGIVIGEFTFDMRDFPNNLGLAKVVDVETIHDRKYIVADHVIHSMSQALYFKQREFPLPSQMYETTINISDSGRASATAISSDRRFARAFLAPTGSDHAYLSEDLDDMVNLNRALDLDETTFATFNDYFDTSGASNTLTGSAVEIDAFTTKLSTTSSHGFSSGEVVIIAGTTNYNGKWTITVVTSTQFTIGTEFVVENFSDTETVDVLDFIGKGVLTFPEYTAGPKDENDIGRTADTGDTAKVTLLDASAAVDKGGGLVGIPITAHTFLAGDRVTLTGTTNYNGLQTVVSVTANEVVITDTFVSETFGATDTMEIRILYIEWHLFANKDSITMDQGYDFLLFGKVLRSGYTLNAWNLGEFLVVGDSFGLNWSDSIVWGLATAREGLPLTFVVRHQSTTGGDATIKNQVVGRIHAAYLVVPYIPVYRLDHFAACKGATYGSWITSRSSAYSSGDAIEDPAGIVESLMRTEAGLVDADFDLPSFIACESSIKARLNLHENYQLNLFDAIRVIVEQSTFAFAWGSDGVARCVDLSDKSPTTDRVIPFSHLSSGNIKVTKTKTIRNRLNIQSRWKEEVKAFANDNTDSPMEDTTSQALAWGILTYNAKWKALAGSHVTTVAAHKVNSTDGIWSKEHAQIEFITIGMTHSDLAEGDWIEMDSESFDSQLLLDGASWSGHQFIVTEIKESGKGTTIKAIELW